MGTKQTLQELSGMYKKRIEKLRKELDKNVKKAIRTRLEQKAEQNR